MLSLQAPPPFVADSFGRSVCVVSDVDADGDADFAIGDGLWASHEVTLEMRSGATLKRIWRTLIPSDDVDCSFIVPASDMSGDGRADVILSLFNSGRVLVVSGTDGLVVREFTSPAPWFGRNVCAGDFNRDGIADVAISNDRDAVNVFAGRDGSALFDIHFASEVVLSLASRFDYDRDGASDLAVWASASRQPKLDLTLCSVRIFSGRSGEELHSFPWLDSTATGLQPQRSPRLPRMLVFENGYEDVIRGSERFSRECAHLAVFAPDSLGHARWALTTTDGVSFQSACCMASDLDGDGVEDIIRGAHEAGSFFQGEVSAYSGKDGTQLWRVAGAGDLGASVASGIDLDQDGISDVIAGAAQLHGCEHNGAVWGISGRTGNVLWQLNRDSP